MDYDAKFLMAASALSVTDAQSLPAFAEPVSCKPGADDDLAWHLLLDDAAVVRARDLRRTLVRPVKSDGPVIRTDNGSAQNPYAFGTLLYDRDRCVFRLWYQTYNRDILPATAVLYAESVDTRTWAMPPGLIACSSPGTSSTVVLRSAGAGHLYSPSVVDVDDESDHARRFKMIYADYIGGTDPYVHGGACVAFSPDGVVWTPYEGNPVLRFERRRESISDVVDIYRDPVTKQFELYSKGWAQWRPGRDGVLRPRYRIITRAVSDDVVNWSEPDVIIDHSHDANDPQSYGMPVFRAGDMRIGLLRSYKKPGNDTMDIRLTASRDGRTWFYPAGFEPYIPNGDPGSFDAGMIMTTGATTSGDTSYIACGGWTGPHEDKVRRASIGMVSTPRHRFLGLSGVFDTVPRRSMGNLSVNVDAAPDRPLLYELVDAQGEVLRGFSRDACRPVTANGVRLPLSFASEAALPRQISIRFHAERAKVFAYCV